MSSNSFWSSSRKNSDTSVSTRYSRCGLDLPDNFKICVVMREKDQLFYDFNGMEGYMLGLEQNSVKDIFF